MLILKTEHTNYLIIISTAFISIYKLVKDNTIKMGWKIMNLRDRDNLRAKDKRPIPKVSFVRRLDCRSCIFLLFTFSLQVNLWRPSPGQRHLGCRTARGSVLSCSVWRCCQLLGWGNRPQWQWHGGQHHQDDQNFHEPGSYNKKRLQKCSYNNIIILYM